MAKKFDIGDFAKTLAQPVPESDTASICSSFRGKSAAYIYFLQKICILLDIFCRSGTIKVLF